MGAQGKTIERRDLAAVLRDRLRDGGAGALANSAGDAPVGFPLLCRHLLHALFESFPAERAYFLLRTPPVPADPAVHPLTIVAAVERGGAPLQNPDYNLDHHYLREVGAVEGARLLAGIDEGAAHSLLTCAFPLFARTRGLVVLEAPPHKDAFPPDSPRVLEQLIRSVSLDLRWMHEIHSQRARIDELTNQLDETAKLLESREHELGGVRSVLEEERAKPAEATTYHEIVTRSALMHEIFSVIERIKDTDLSTLIIGETGTGKELIARAIHFGGKRARQPFEAIACGTLATSLLESELFGYRRGAFSGAESDRKGVFERASGGTVFLDEVSDMPPEMQQKILRVLQEKTIRPIGAERTIPVDVRIIASSQHDLAEWVEQGRFREDLYYRLNVIALEVPPLRDRREDLPLLIAQFLAERAEEEEVTKRFSESALRELYQYSWPGNIQELRNVVTRAFIVSSRRVISRRIVLPLLKNQTGNLFAGDGLVQDGDHITLSIPYSEGFNNLINECERLILLSALRRNRGNKSRVTQQLRIPRQTLYNKLEKYGIVESDYADTGATGGNGGG
ncbi:MAG: sigma-54 dependent transcriptional regulator [Planctomycetes bacterium]|nr:sigma-54 dependent transcriptional regulator [Planctomycetota bacterium]